MPNLRILVIDDSYRKRERICETLRKAFERHDLVLTEATDYEEAIAALTNRYYDLVVLDILLPAAGGSPSEDVSRALIHQIMRGTLTAPMHIIGLTAYHNVGVQEQRFYDENLFALEFYSESTNEWAGKLVSKVNYLLRLSIGTQKGPLIGVQKGPLCRC